MYARVSTDDKGQDLETQLMPMRAEAEKRGWQIEYQLADKAPAGEARKRHGWEQALKLAKAGAVDALMVWKMDRAFRSVRDAANTLAALEGWKVPLVSATEAWLDMTTPSGRLVTAIMAAVAAFEKDLTSERVKAGMDRARAQGRHVGRPRKAEAAEG